MPSLPLPLAAVMLLVLLPGPASAQRERYEIAQVIMRQRVVVRVQRTAPVAPQAIRWVEKKGPKCIALAKLAGALVTRPDAIDLVSQGGGRVRAQLGKNCPALGFYANFYLRPTTDGMVCAGRDAVRSRSGRACEIDKFRKLVPKR